MNDDGELSYGYKYWKKCIGECVILGASRGPTETKRLLTLSRPSECSGHLQILLCLTPDDFTRQWGTSWTGRG